MPRSARASAAGYCDHAIDRGNARAEVFHKPEDYAAFLRVVAEAGLRTPMRVVAYVLVPNHFHLVFWPSGDGDLSRWMRWLLTAHVRRYRRHHGGNGHVRHGRFKAFRIEESQHMMPVIRYVERNALRAGLVDRAEQWPWSSLRGNDLPVLDPGPVPRGPDWRGHVNAPMTHGEVGAIRLSMRRDRPHGSETWTVVAAVRLGLESSLRPRGRQPSDMPETGHPEGELPSLPGRQS
ncbi:transposase [Aquisphaera insulae]|uniref:transposase n=1 Tax=Aquisphaera insulae TaxID=2712864 RepID=UPI0013E9A45C|nr:transposase [Aquisphaera insulae]